MEQRFVLGHRKAKKIHKEIVSAPNAYSLTITLKPYYNSQPVHEQHRLMQNELRNLLVKLNRYYNVVMFTPEFTKDYNIHYHCYFILPQEMDVQTFNQNFKRLRLKRGVIGPNYKLKQVDDVTETLINYPFKDITRTLKYSSIENCLFQPYHAVIQGRNPWKLQE